jgi:hypothetical protein
MKWKTFTANGIFYDPNLWTIERDGDRCVIEQPFGNDKARVIDDPLFVEGQTDSEIIRNAIFECFPDPQSARKN